MTWNLGRDKVVSFLTVILVTTSKSCRDHSFFQSYRNHIFESRQFLFNSASFSGRDLESVSRLSGGPSYLVLVAVAQNLVTACLNCSAHFDVTTSLVSSAYIFVAGSIFLIRDLVSWSSHPFLVATSILYHNIFCAVLNFSLSRLLTRMS